ncbi:MAG: tRNA 2-thiouridine(34) synthase MnmA [Deltaproteobacteria bacterium]|nr:tRNA 2-thiouridine(34) synthase MnmA [Deltaproteobacteria bacterium]MBP7290789.1 tRNA 2-thiouridine(34) synthase MnmA [Nannocystaceae bacterium]
MKIVCAMSGGVDSSIAAALLVEAGHEVLGMTMRLYDASARGRAGSCCSPAEIDQAREVCAQLGIGHWVVDERERFAAAVIEPFADDYAAGRTPNPCTRCNQSVKFAPLLTRARALGAERLATGHYARHEHGRLLRARDASKDQSYFLFAMGADALAQTLFPLGTWTKDEVRAKATALGLPNADAPDSQELCFVPDGDHGAVVQSRLAARGLATDMLAPGPVVDVDGRVLGRHDGIHRVTVGQRRGLHVPGTERRYVLRVVPESRTVVVGEANDAALTRLQVGELQRFALVDGEHRLLVQVRHRGQATPARVWVEGAQARVEFDAAQPGVAPGQAAVFYDDDAVVGGGWISAGSQR